MKYEEIKILDIEKTEDGTRLEVPFEVPGKHFNQSYPKRLKHSFENKEKFLEVVDDETGERRFEKIMKDLYLKDTDQEEKELSDDTVSKVKEKFKGKKLNKEGR